MLNRELTPRKGNWGRRCRLPILTRKIPRFLQSRRGTPASLRPPLRHFQRHHWSSVPDESRTLRVWTAVNSEAMGTVDRHGTGGRMHIH